MKRLHHIIKHISILLILCLIFTGIFYWNPVSTAYATDMEADSQETSQDASSEESEDSSTDSAADTSESQDSSDATADSSQNSSEETSETSQDASEETSTISYLDDSYSDYLSQLTDISTSHDIYGVVYLCDSYDLKEAPSADSATTASLPSGTTVTIKAAHIIDEDGSKTIWYQVNAYYMGSNYTGYITRDYMAVSDSEFLEWEETMKYQLKSNVQRRLMKLAKSSVSYSDIEQFPESYQSALKALKDSHPNWIFVAQDAGDWSKAVNAEVKDKKSLISKSFPEYDKEGLCETSWFYASEDILKYYMDPRNWLTESYVFQFEQLTYNATYHTESAVEQVLSSTFMKSGATGRGLESGQTYANIFYSTGKEYNVSPFHLAARVIQEQGKEGTSSMISGKYSGYEGYYNYFNIKATSGSNTDKLNQGLTYAKNQEWTSAAASIKGGAKILSANYIAKGQDTLYLQKFNITSTNTYAHQYMQNIAAPSGEAVSVCKQYKAALGGSLASSTFVFKIPVYSNMPSSACAKPTSTTNVVLKIPSGYDTTVYIDGVEKSGVSRNGQYIINTGNTSARTATVYKYSNGVPTGMYVWTITYKDGNYDETDQSAMTDLLGYHGFSIRISGKSGIRFKSSIGLKAKQSLTSSGIDGYKLVEYGTLIMNKSNLASLPFTYGGKKVQCAVAYNSSIDNVYATLNNRCQYTAVLTGIPSSSYKTNLAFRAYAVLEKNGEKSVIYGPILSKSIYDLANQYIKNNTYSSGSSQYKYLQSIINDAK